MATSVAELVFQYGVPFALANEYMAGNPNASLEQALKAYDAYKNARASSTPVVDPYTETLNAIREQAQKRETQGISEQDLTTYGQNIGLTQAEIDYALGNTNTVKDKSDLNQAIAGDAYITKLATDLGDTNVTANEQLALSDPEVRQLAENAWQRQNVDNISDTDLASYGKELGLNQDLIDYLLGKEMNLGTDYDIGSSVDKAVAKEQAEQAAIRATGKDPTKMTTADYLAAVLDTATPTETKTGTKTGTSTVKGGTGTDTVKGGTGTSTVKGGTGTSTVKGGTGTKTGTGGAYNDKVTYTGDIGEERVGRGVDVSGESGIRQAYAPYVERLLERASAEADVPFQRYTGESPLLESARAGIANLTTPAQFLQGSNLATAAGIGALEYGKYKPTAFTTGTFANPNFAAQSAAAPAEPVGADKVFYESFGRTPNQTELGNLKTYLQSTPDYAAYQKTLKPAAQGGVMSLVHYDVGGAVAGGGGIFDYIGRQPTEKDTIVDEDFGVKYDPDFGRRQPIDDAEAKEKAEANSRPYFYDRPGPYPEPVNLGGGSDPYFYDKQQPNTTSPYTVPANSNIQPVNYGGQNVTNVQASYMSPYMQGVIDPAIREARRQSDIMGQTTAAKAVGAGAFGGSRHGLVEAERQRNLATQLGDIQSKGLQEAYTQGLGQFNTEQQRGLEAQKMAEQSRQFGAELGLKGLQTGIQASTALGDLGYRQNLSDLATLKQMADLGKEQRDFDYNEFLRGEKYPYQNLEFMKNILSVIPSAALSPAAEAGSAIPGGTADAFSTYLQALQAMGKIIPGGASGGLISGIATLGD